VPTWERWSATLGRKKAQNRKELALLDGRLDDYELETAFGVLLCLTIRQAPFVRQKITGRS
jgi:hypothetical protein